jgi:hypothetical protein
MKNVILKIKQIFCKHKIATPNLWINGVPFCLKCNKEYKN